MDKPKLSLLGRLNIGPKLALTPLLSTVVLTGIMIYTLLTVQGQQADALLVDLAGRQRMLNQRQTTEILLASQGLPADYQATHSLLERTLTALMDGGKAVLNPASGATVMLPPAPTPAIRAKLEENQRLFRHYTVAAEALLETQFGTVDYANRLSVLLTARDQIHIAANQAVKLFTAHSSDKLAFMLQAGFIITAIVAVLGSLFAWLMARHILHPLNQTMAVLERVAGGDLTRRVAVDNRDEIGRMARAINRLIADVHRAVQADAVDWEAITAQRQELHRIQQIIEHASSNILYVDHALRLGYLNPASRQTLQTLQRWLPTPVAQLPGQSIQFLGVEQAQLTALFEGSDVQPQKQLTALGDEKLRLELVAIRDEQRRPVGVLVTWAVVTQELKTQALAREAAERERFQNQQLQTQVGSLLDVVRAAAKGDLTHQITVRGEDAMGQMGTGLEQFLQDLRRSIAEIGDTARTLASASEEMRVVSQQMGDNATHTSADAERVSGAADQVSHRVEAVAAAAEQMSTSVREIADNTAEVSQAAASAVKITAGAHDTMSRLNQSSGEIDNVIKVITAIAEQTNLLALNATIEAARAGEAGKGFAVVANEVKDLARETARATEDIGAKITCIQADTKSAVAAITEIDCIINNVNNLQRNVASALEQQASVTNEITANVADAARGSSDIANNIVTVATTAQNTTSASQDVQQAAAELAQVAARLEGLVSRFRYE